MIASAKITKGGRQEKMPDLVKRNGKTELELEQLFLRVSLEEVRVR